MSKESRAHYFWVEIDNYSTEAIIETLSKHNDTSVEKDFIYNTQQYRITEMLWHKADKAFTACVYKLREDNLPARCGKKGTTSLNLDKEEKLGEPMIFAYYPNEYAMSVHYNHHGPRHGVIPACLEQAGINTIAHLAHILQTDKEERLRYAKGIRWLDATIKLPKFSMHHKENNNAVKGIIDTAQYTGSHYMHAKLTVGHSTDNLKNVWETAKSLLHLNENIFDQDEEKEEEEADQKSSLDKEETPKQITKVTQKLQIGIIEGDDNETKTLDLLGARMSDPITLTMKNRELNHKACCDQLLSIFSNKRIHHIRKQREGYGGQNEQQFK